MVGQRNPKNHGTTTPPPTQRPRAQDHLATASAKGSRVFVVELSALHAPVPCFLPPNGGAGP